MGTGISMSSVNKIKELAEAETIVLLWIYLNIRI